MLPKLRVFLMTVRVVNGCSHYTSSTGVLLFALCSVVCERVSLCANLNKRRNQMFRDGLAATNPNSDRFNPLLQDIHSRARLCGHHTKPSADSTGSGMDQKSSSSVAVVVKLVVQVPNQITRAGPRKLYQVQQYVRKISPHKSELPKCGGNTSTTCMGYRVTYNTCGTETSSRVYTYILL